MATLNNLPFLWDEIDNLIGNIYYTENAEVCCKCPLSGKFRKMAPCGFEKDRGTLKFRCPAAAYGKSTDCEGWKQCHKDAGVDTNGYGRIVRVKLEKNWRIFTPTPRDSRTWKDEYNRRSSLERIFSRVDDSFRFEKHYIRGEAKMTARAGLAVCVMMALAIGHIKAGRPEKMRSLVSECPRAG